MAMCRGYRPIHGRASHVGSYVAPGVRSKGMEQGRAQGVAQGCRLQQDIPAAHFHPRRHAERRCGGVQRR
eukprot:3498877-Pyramimonas_sp.AAC.1